MFHVKWYHSHKIFLSPPSEPDNGLGHVVSRDYYLSEGQSYRNSYIFLLILLYALISQRLNKIQLFFMQSHS